MWPIALLAAMEIFAVATESQGPLYWARSMYMLTVGRR